MPTREEMIAAIEAHDKKNTSREEMITAILNKPQLLDQPHPDQEKFFKDRFLIKNLGGTVQDSLDYLKLKHPTYDFQANRSGDIFLKNKSESDYKALDPSSYQGLGEIGRDALDLTAPVLQGIGTVGGAALGGLLGPAGSAVGGAATGGGLEALKQALGNQTGVRKDYDLKNIGIATALGLVPAAGKLVGKAIGPAENLIEIAPTKFQLPGPAAPSIYENALNYVKDPATWKKALKLSAGVAGIRYLSKH